MLVMDSLTEIEDPDLAIDTARLHLEGVCDAALDVYRLLDVARNETAHIGVAAPRSFHGRRTGNHRSCGPVDLARASGGDVEDWLRGSEHDQLWQASDSARYRPAHARRWESSRPRGSRRLFCHSLRKVSARLSR